MTPYETFEHTADIGLRMRGRNLTELFTNAGRGFFDLITDFDKIEKSDLPRIPVRIVLEAKDSGGLLLAWLRELLFIFSSKRLVLTEFDFKKINETGLEALAYGILFDPSCHDQKYEVKAVTYHAFRLEKREEDWLAEVILDI